MTVRQVFYQATVKGSSRSRKLDTTRLQTTLTLMRRDGASLTIGWRQYPQDAQAPIGFEDQPGDRKDRSDLSKNDWDNADATLRYGSKRTHSPASFPVTSQYDGPLMVARGYAACQS